MSSKPPSSFGVRKDQEDILTIPIPDKTGIGIARLHMSLVPVFEEHHARIEAKYSIHEWYGMTPEMRAFEVAHYRLRNAVQIHSMKVK